MAGGPLEGWPSGVPPGGSGPRSGRRRTARSDTCRPSSPAGETCDRRVRVGPRGCRDSTLASLMARCPGVEALPQGWTWPQRRGRGASVLASPSPPRRRRPQGRRGPSLRGPLRNGSQVLSGRVAGAQMLPRAVPCSSTGGWWRPTARPRTGGCRGRASRRRGHPTSIRSRPSPAGGPQAGATCAHPVTSMVTPKPTMNIGQA